MSSWLPPSTRELFRPPFRAPKAFAFRLLPLFGVLQRLGGADHAVDRLDPHPGPAPRAAPARWDLRLGCGGNVASQGQDLAYPWLVALSDKYVTAGIFMGRSTVGLVGSLASQVA